MSVCLTVRLASLLIGLASSDCTVNERTCRPTCGKAVHVLHCKHFTHTVRDKFHDFSEIGLEENLDTMGLISGLFNCFFSIGYVNVVGTYLFVLLPTVLSVNENGNVRYFLFCDKDAHADVVCVCDVTARSLDPLLAATCWTSWDSSGRASVSQPSAQPWYDAVDCVHTFFVCEKNATRLRHYMRFV